jgi:hypothetical protein
MIHSIGGHLAHAGARRIAGGVLLLYATGCATWRPLSGTMAQNVRAESIPTARVALRDGRQLMLSDVVIRADSVYGYDEGERARRAFALSDVGYVEERRVSVARTLAAVGGVAAMALLIYVVLLVQALRGEGSASPAPMPSVP